MVREHADRRIGRYVLFDEIARGGMAAVHIGRLDADESFRRTVAIKRLHPGSNRDGDVVAMLRDEARISARIRHPNVVPVVDVVTSDDELLLVMEYVHGESLAALLDAAQAAGQRPPVAIVAQIMANVLSGLHAAHQTVGDDGRLLEVVHRDVSPQNILVGQDGIARIVDFGIARARERSRATTREGVVRGKIPYMSPEQLSEEAVDRRTDVYAAAVVLWEAVTGKLLFDDATPIVLTRKLTEEPEHARLYAPEIPPALDDAIAKGLAGDPALRWASAEEMAHAIERAVPLVSPREIGRWVESLAGPTLERRARILARAEGRRELTPTMPTMPDLEEVKPVSRRSRVPAIATALVTLAALAVGLVVLRTRAAAPPTREARETPIAAASAEPPPPVVSAPRVEPTPVAVTTPAVASAPTPVAKRSTPRPKPACDPPYRIDDRGVRVLKKECF